MNDTVVVHLAMQSMIVGFKLAAPVLLTSLIIGFGISLLQSVTQVQEVTLSFVPKMLGCGVALLVSGHWMMTVLVSYTRELFASLPSLLGSG